MLKACDSVDLPQGNMPSSVEFLSPVRVIPNLGAPWQAI
ncbi:MAG: hypothetical protein RL375_878 [Pseudomonadota bacterium]|jgi:hypothetical protein